MIVEVKGIADDVHIFGIAKPSQTDERRAACVWQSPSGWTGRRFHFGTNKEVFDAETFAIYQALHVLDRRQESGHRYAVFVGSTAVISQ